MTAEPTYAIDPEPRVSLGLAGRADRFPVRRIYCVGQNYRAHALEMGANPDREPPFFFMKPADAIRGDGSSIAYPPATHDLHHEVELVVAIGSGGTRIAPRDALRHTRSRLRMTCSSCGLCAVELDSGCTAITTSNKNAYMRG